MAVFRPFKGIRPQKELAAQVACLPYDVMNRSEAKGMAEGNPRSFLHVVRSEIDLPESVSPYDPEVYLKARENLERFQEEGTLIQDDTPRFYIYRQLMNGRVQTGLVGCTAVDDYEADIIKKHEFTRPEKEVDRINNFDVTDANTEPIFLTYRKNDTINQLINDWIKFHMPEYNFTSEDGIQHIFWVIDSEAVNDEIHRVFQGIDYLYIADGHHRSASANKVAKKRREANPGHDGSEEFNFFMSVLFPDEDLFIMDYNRVVKDLNGLSTEAFLKGVGEKFQVTPWEGEGPFKPMTKGTVGMYLQEKWYVLKAGEGIFDPSDPIDRLDVSILQKNLLGPLLGIEDPRTDKRIDFVGGIRGLEELERRVATDMKVAFSMYPTTMEELLAIADAGVVMPPKSTWFEPKLRSGLFVHSLRG